MLVGCQYNYTLMILRLNLRHLKSVENHWQHLEAVLNFSEFREIREFSEFILRLG